MTRPPRVAAIDILRGIVMAIMAIDHSSETFNAGRIFSDGAGWYKPGTPLPVDQFLTRWISHICAPTFVALAGTALAIAAESRKARGEADSKTTRDIFLRGLLILCIEVLWMSWLMVGVGNILFQVLFAIGTSLMCMAFMRRLPDRALLAFGVIVILGLEVLMPLRGGLPLAVLATGGVFFNAHLFVGYPILPWLAMMCLGWAFGRRLVIWKNEGKDEVALATRVLVIFGVLGLVVSGVLRGINAYGNMGMYRESGELVQWLHMSKYPPSITYVGLELGLAALILAALMQIKGAVVPTLLKPLHLIGQTALFFYVIHLHVLHLFAWLTHTHEKLGVSSSYVGALGILLVLYPLCFWYRRYKSAHPDSWARWL